MRYILTSDEIVEQLRKQAKKLQRELGGKYTELLESVAKQAGYDHWHHVVECNGRGKAAASMAALRRECESIIAAALRSQIKILTTGPEIGVSPLVLFSSAVGDAWLLDPSVQIAMCLVLSHKRVGPTINQDPLELEIVFDGHYELLGDFFHIESHHKLIGDRTFGGYPLSELRPILEQVKPLDIRIAETLVQFDTVEMTPEVMAQMAKKGYSQEELEKMKSAGFRYSPSRDSLLTPIFSSEDDDFQESHPS